MQTIQTAATQVITTLNSPDCIRRPILDFPTDEIEQTLMQSYMLLVALDTNSVREGFEQDIHIIARWLTTPQRQGLIISGKVGTGKTTLARAMWATMRYHGAPSKGCEASKLADIYKNDEKNGWWQLFNASRLIIDDLGREYTSTKNYGSEDSQILAILREFYKNRKTLIITTNLNEKGIAERYGEDIADRLWQICNYMELSNTQTYRR